MRDWLTFQHLLPHLSFVQINPPVWPVNVAALLGKSTATDFLQRVKEKRAAECFPEDCSTEVGEAEELTEGYVSFKGELLYSLLRCIYSKKEMQLC